MAFVLITALAVAAFAGGVVSLANLRQLGSPTDRERADPFLQSVTFLFSTEPRGEAFRKVQRRTIWLFCGAILLLFAAKQTL